MNTRKASIIIVGLLLCLVTALAAPQGAMAVPYTPACTQIGNSANVNFNVGGAAQALVTSATVTVVVGNRVDHTVTTTDAGFVTVATSQTATLHFLITNTGNAAEKYALSVVDLASGSSWSVFGSSQSDNFQTTVASASTPTTAFVLGIGGSVAVTIIGTMPAALTENWQDVLALKAQAVNPITNVVEANTVSAISTNGTVSACTSDIVLGDGAGQDDAARDGIQSARSGYVVHLTTMSVTKTSLVYCDPFNGCGAGAKAIPGATVEYTVVVKNSAGPNIAQSVTISDQLASTLTPTGYSSGWTSSPASGSHTCAANQAWTSTGGCVSSFWSGNVAGATGTATVGDLATGATGTIVFQATIN